MPLTSLKAFFESLIPASPERAASGHSLQVATAVLLVEVMRADAHFTLSERAAVLVALRERFSLTGDEVEALFAVADDAARGAHDLHAFTSRLNETLQPEDKASIVESMWQVAYADGRLESHEQHLMWRIADLLHVPHGAYIAAKMRAKEHAL